MAKKYGLGKGLNVLIPDDDSVNKISINSIKPNKKQARKHFDEDELISLSNSIKEHGLIQPIVVKPDKNDYIIIAGERRWRASKKAGIKEIPAIIMNVSDKKVLELSLIENIQREDLNPIEEAAAYKDLLEDFDITQEELSKRISKSRSSITNTMRLLSLDSRVQDFIIERKLTEGHGRAILSEKSLSKQYEVALEVIKRRLSVRETEKLLSNSNKDKENKKKDKTDPYIKDIEDRLARSIGTKVRVKHKNNNKGKIEIEYYSNEELNRLLEYLRIEE
ncbi:MAG: ParB/RepB/Spo0J family partition protein [Clostridium sp.]|nr:ParB/RepB/Spo0J family partition protein [Clostridium sp.]